MNGVTVALAVLAGGLLSLERKTIGQFMLSRPIVVAPIIAAILGDAQTGFALGIPLELVFLGTTSYGGSTPYHETLAALFAASLAAASPAHHGTSGLTHGILILPIAFFLSLPFAGLGRWYEAATERWNVNLVDRAEEILASGHTGLATRQAFIGLMGTFVMGAAVVALGALLGSAAGDWDETLPRWLDHGLRLAWPLALGTSAALTIRVVRTPHSTLLSGIAAGAVFGVYALAQLISG